MRPAAVTFDFGQTLTELDCALLSRRLGERSLSVSAQALAAALPSAWQLYEREVSSGRDRHPWRLLMASLLRSAGVQAGAELDEAVSWLWLEQPVVNLWRKPIAGMIELVRRIKAAGIPVGVVSNSEGRLAELADELGWADAFDCIGDSGRLGVEKPCAEIFQWVARQLSVTVDATVHVGDSWSADVEGALAVGARAIWFVGAVTAFSDGDAVADVEKRPEVSVGRVRVARTAADVDAALRSWGLAR